MAGTPLQQSRHGNQVGMMEGAHNEILGETSMATRGGVVTLRCICRWFTGWFSRRVMLFRNYIIHNIIMIVNKGLP